MATMGSRNPEVPRLNDLGSLAKTYTDYISKPEFENSRNILQGYVDEQEKEALKAEELRRYNQEFAIKQQEFDLKQAAANRDQAIYERGLNTDNALLDYQNIIRGTSQGGILDNTQGMNLANEYEKLVGTVGEEKAAEIINTKAQMLAQQDAKRAQSDPFYAANKVQGLTINGNRYGSIDPTKLIDMQTGIVNDLVKRGESLRDHNATEAYRNKSLALEREKMNQQLKKEQDQSKRFADYLKAIAENPTQVLVPGSTTQGITNQAEMDNYANNLTASSNQYNQIVKGITDKGELELNLGYKPNPGSSVKIPIKKTITGKELEDYAHEQAFKQTFGNYDFSKAPQAHYGEIKVEDKYVPKTREQLLEDRLRILINSNLPASTMQEEYEKLVPTRTGPKTEKEALEIQKLEAEITKKNAETKKVMAETGADKKGKDVPKNIGQNTANVIGGSDAKDLLNKLDTIARKNNIPIEDMYKILDQANNTVIESGLFNNVNEDAHEKFIKDQLWLKYRIDLK